MSLPVILFNSQIGSDTAASGAGPTQAITGNNASTSADGLTVTLDGSPDLSGVATDGSHVIWLNDATLGNRNFGKITNVDDIAKTVTVSNAFGTLLSGKSWAIGGKRLTLANAMSATLYNNNNSNGDWMSGWEVRLESGYTETLSVTIVLYRLSDNATGPMIFRGDPAASTLPILTFSNNGNAISLSHDGKLLENLVLRNSNATKTASIGIYANNRVCILRNLRISAASPNNFWKGIAGFGARSSIMESCDVANCANLGVGAIGNSNAIFNNRIHGCGSHGISITSTVPPFPIIIGNHIYGNAGDGISITNSATTDGNGFPLIERNTIHGNTGDGIDISSSSTQIGGFRMVLLQNNQFTGNGGWGLNFSNASPPSDAVLFANFFTCRNNNYGTGALANTSGDCNVTLTLTETGKQNLNPGYTDATNGDFRPSIAVAGLGWPTGLAGGTAPTGCREYVDIGMQRYADFPAVDHVWSDTVDGVAGSLIVPGAASGEAELHRERGSVARGGSGKCAMLTPSSASSPGYWDFYTPGTGGVALTVSFWHKITAGFDGTLNVSIFDFDNGDVLLDQESVALVDDGDWHQHTCAAVTPQAAISSSSSSSSASSGSTQTVSSSSSSESSSSSSSSSSKSTQTVSSSSSSTPSLSSSSSSSSSLSSSSSSSSVSSSSSSSSSESGIVGLCRVRLTVQNGATAGKVYLDDVSIA